MVTPTPETYRRSVPAIEPDSPRSKDSKPAAKRTSPQSTKSTHKFYLDLEDHIEAAPSIGPKTAERFEKIGVFTIAEFLKQTADSMAAKLNYKRMSAEVVRSWQQQARLVCRIPNLRGHDAQLLVACEIFEPEEIASMQPQALFRIIQPFSDTKEGLKIIRSGKKPDLAEITDWIAWAQHTRSLQAA
jgi:predicted flap endonuclease-1-like 5' DNA nuclease